MKKSYNVSVRYVKQVRAFFAALFTGKKHSAGEGGHDKKVAATLEVTRIRPMEDIIDDYKNGMSCSEIVKKSFLIKPVRNVAG